MEKKKKKLTLISQINQKLKWKKISKKEKKNLKKAKLKWEKA